MKKLFSLFLALSLLFLTACNIAPSTGTTATGSSSSSTATGSSSSSTDSNASSDHSTSSNTQNNENPKENWQDALKDQIIPASNNEMLEATSRILFEGHINNSDYTLYYSKADEKIYVFCFDPLCDHKECMAQPGKDFLLGWSFYGTVPYGNRFYSVTGYGQILSFSFDGTDRKIEYDLNYAFPPNRRYTVWNLDGLYGPYLYISLSMDQSGYERHTLRYNLETKEMEDLTEKTGNVIEAIYFYNGMIYGYGGPETVDTIFKTDLDLKTMEIVEEPMIMDQHSGSLIIGTVIKERENLEERPEQIGVSFYDIKTGEQRILTKEQLGLDYYPTFIYATEEYLYFYNSEIVNLGTTTVDRPNGSQITMKIQKMNDGKLYRMNLDGTNIVCVHDNPDYELGRNMIIYDDRVVMKGRYVTIENGEKKVWGGQLQVAVINEDGTFGEFREVEVIG